jgi:hypothetical protein
MGRTLIQFPMSATVKVADALTLDRAYDENYPIVYDELGSSTLYDEQQELTGTVRLMRCLAIDP